MISAHRFDIKLITGASVDLFDAQIVNPILMREWHV